MASVIKLAKESKVASCTLARLSDAERNAALKSIAERLSEMSKEIIEANEKDLSAARRLVDEGQLSASLYQRLKLDRDKLADVVKGVRQVASLQDPLHITTLKTELDTGLILSRTTCPLGVVGVIFEARPDALVQIASLCIKSGNGLLLKGGSEARHTNRALFETIREALRTKNIPVEIINLLESREDVASLLKAEGYVDLIIPRGSNELVRHIQQNTVIPVLGHADGICHLYIDNSADSQKSISVAVDGKTQYPAACNAIETILIHQATAKRILHPLLEALKQKKVEIRCDQRCIEEFGTQNVTKASDEDWKTEYSDLIVSIKIVDSIEEAITHITRFGSHHTEVIMTEERAQFEKFLSNVDAAGVYWNASSRFADGFRYGFGAEVGISTSKLHPRGPVGLEGLVTYKYSLVGDGHIVADYSGAGAKAFTHTDLLKNKQTAR